ncbi:MAG: hypothetical protein VX026_14185 [Myxococcota bacterium]|nr:hypothetical protein [Myxococcota bacterium]
MGQIQAGSDMAEMARLSLLARPKPSPSPARSGNLGIWEPTKNKKCKFSKSESVLPKMLARSGLVEQKILVPFGAISNIFSMGMKNINIKK